MEEGTGAMNITATGHEGSHKAALVIGAFGRSQRRGFRVERLKEGRCGMCAKTPNGRRASGETGLVSPAPFPRRAESYHGSARMTTGIRPCCPCLAVSLF